MFRRVSVALAAFTLACGDSTGPNLSEAEVIDMLDAMSSVSALAAVPVPGMGMSALRASSTPTANATVTLSETVDCPNGGTATVNGTATDNEANGTATLVAQITQGFSGCAATSTEGRLWTFNGNPNIVTNLSASSNETTGAFSLTLSQAGGIRFESDLGSGTCQINLTMTLSGNETSLTANVDGTACGRRIQQSVEVTQ